MKENKYNYLIDNIGQILEEGRRRAVQSVNTLLVETYWNIGKQIVEYEQEGKEKAEYGSKLLNNLSNDLKLRYGKGFSIDNLEKMRKFYILFENSVTVSRNLQTLSAKLSWSHYIELLSVDNDLARGFYEKQCINEKWSVRELKRQKNSLLFERIAKSKDKEGVLELSRKGQIIEKSEDLIKDPTIIEFFNMPENYKYTEKEIEQKIIDNLQMFLLELGKGFTFAGRQKRISIDNEHYYIDLVFYNCILKCYFLIDLKIGKLTHQDIGQMDFYVRYFEKEIKGEGDNQTVGLILCSDKSNVMAKYTLLEDKKNVFASKYKLYLPTEEEFEKEIGKLL